MVVYGLSGVFTNHLSEQQYSISISFVFLMKILVGSIVAECETCKKIGIWSDINQGWLLNFLISCEEVGAPAIFETIFETIFGEWHSEVKGKLDPGTLFNQLQSQSITLPYSQISVQVSETAFICLIFPARGTWLWIQIQYCLCCLTVLHKVYFGCPHCYFRPRYVGHCKLKRMRY